MTARGRAQRPTARLVGEELRDRLRQAVDVLGSDEHAGVPVEDSFRDAPDVGGDDGQLGEHGFEQGEWKPLEA